MATNCKWNWKVSSPSRKQVQYEPAVSFIILKTDGRQENIKSMTCKNKKSSISVLIDKKLVFTKIANPVLVLI